ncbi:MAG: geranylgeranylglycerol-phosphate geranylgeranyltransferase [Flavobacteriales bacterium]|jgi:4-hydroxybenzoate polyprenyltransferase|nr:geranylgeranylglycerol-phosphate geranylgeranyltransferase [Flavobacteriales bacterium]
MLHFLRLTRPLNLLIIAATMAVMRVGVIDGHLGRGLHALAAEAGVPTDELVRATDGLGARMPVVHFVLLVLSTVLIAAGGNVINDYFDMRIDRINKPGRVIVGALVQRRKAMIGHWALSGAGMVLGLFVAWRSHLPHLALIPAFSIIALWWYSLIFKRRWLIGNGLVALLTALVPLTVGLYEIPLLRRAHPGPVQAMLSNDMAFEIVPAFGDLWWWIGGYAAFAFLATLAREMQKDMADVKGDAAHGRRTIPIAWGMRAARAITMLYIGITIAGLLFVRATVLTDPFSYWYIGLAVVLPLLLSAAFTYQAHDRRGHVRAGHLMKVAMVMAVAYALTIRFTG